MLNVKQTAGNNELLAAIKTYYGNNKFFKDCSGIMNVMGEEAVISHIQSVSVQKVTKEVVIAAADSLKATLV